MTGSFLIIEMMSVCGFNAAAFDEYETAKLRAFLMQESAEPGIRNYQQIGMTSMNDINWDDVPGLSWNSLTYTLVRLVWPNMKLSGNLDVSGFESLRDIYCAFNKINSINVSNCPSLLNIDLYTNDLYKIDVSTNENLRYLRLGYNNLQTVDISHNPNLMFLCCTENQVKMLDVSNQASLCTLYCIGNGLHTLLVDNCVALERLLCGQNDLTSLNLNNLPSLETFSSFMNPINDLQLHNCTSLQNLECKMNELSDLDVTRCKKLTALDCSSNQLTTMNISGCNQLTSLNCDNNFLSTLDISDAPLLAKLSCKNNNLTFLTLPLFKPPLTTYSYSPQQYIDLECDYNDINLNAFYKIDNVISNYNWYYQGTIAYPLVRNEGRFVFDESYIGKTLICRVTNQALRLLVMHFDVTFTRDGVSNNIHPKTGKPTVYAGEQTIHINAETAAAVSIYSLQGSLQLRQTVSAGHTSIPIERGIYVVVVNDATSYKVIIK